MFKNFQYCIYIKKNLSVTKKSTEYLILKKSIFVILNVIQKVESIVLTIFTRHLQSNFTKKKKYNPRNHKVNSTFNLLSFKN